MLPPSQQNEGRVRLVDCLRRRGGLACLCECCCTPVRDDAGFKVRVKVVSEQDQLSGRSPGHDSWLLLGMRHFAACDVGGFFISGVICIPDTCVNAISCALQLYISKTSYREIKPINR